MQWPKTKVPTGVSQWGMSDNESLFPEIANFNYIVSGSVTCPV